MADLTKDTYLQYAKRIVSVLHGDAFFEQYRSRVETGASAFKLVKKRLIQDISVDWIDTIEDCLPNLDTIVRNPRKFIVQEEDIVDVSLAKSISTESVKHLAQHTNMISKVDEDGNVTPSKILNITKEESFEIYENRFIYTLLLKLKDFVTIRYDKIKKASSTQDVLQLNVDSRFNLPTKKITYRTEYMAQLSFDEVMQLDPDTLTKVERIAKIDRIITDFLSSSFAKSMRGSAPVRPPITRTNVILKEPNFKKALTLWQFVETYEQTGGFSTSDDIDTYDIEDEATAELRNMVTLNTMLFESLYEEHETDFGTEDASFLDFKRVGDMDFEPDKLDRDEYSQKPVDEKLEEDADKEEVAEAVPDEELPPEDVPEAVENPEEEETVEEEETPEVTPPPQEPEIVIEEVEMPPKEDFDEEPDEDKFDQNLFDVRKIYKRPAEDRLRQEELAKIKDAIDRCLISYRKIKQADFDEKERAEEKRLREQDMFLRAEAFRKQRDAVEREYAAAREALAGTDFFGRAEVGAPRKRPVKPADRPKDVALELNDADVENVRRSIEEAEALEAERSALYSDEEPRVSEEIPVLALDEIEARLREKEEARRAAARERRKAKRSSVETVADVSAGEGQGSEEIVADSAEPEAARTGAEEPESAVKPAVPEISDTKPKRSRARKSADAFVPRQWSDAPVAPQERLFRYTDLSGIRMKFEDADVLRAKPEFVVGGEEGQPAAIEIPSLEVDDIEARIAAKEAERLARERAKRAAKKKEDGDA